MEIIAISTRCQCYHHCEDCTQVEDDTQAREKPNNMLRDEKDSCQCVKD